MPGLTLNPEISWSKSIHIFQHDNASDFLSTAYSSLRRHEVSSNIILAHALKGIKTEAALSSCQFTTDSDVDPVSWSSHPHPSSSFWLTVWSSQSPSSAPVLDLVLSCGSWILGDYPIFLWTPRSSSSLPHAWLAPRISALTTHMLSSVAPERVFSVFGMTPLVIAFSRCWTEVSGFPIASEPFYAAYLTYCTPTTFKASEYIIPDGDHLRRPSMDDLNSVAQLCREFADDSVGFRLFISRAKH